MSTARALDQAHDDGDDVILSPEQEAELEQVIAETDEDFRAGRCVPAEAFCAERGIPYRPARTG